MKKAFSGLKNSFLFFFARPLLQTFCLLNRKVWLVLLITGFCFSIKGFTQSRTFTPGNGQVFIVPDGVTSINIKAWGGGGGTSFGDTARAGGGGGGYVEKRISVSSGDVIYINVGSAGAAATVEETPGGSGGNSTVTHAGSSTNIFAGGGGGGGKYRHQFGLGGSATGGAINFNGGNGEMGGLTYGTGNGQNKNGGGGGGGGQAACSSGNGKNGVKGHDADKKGAGSGGSGGTGGGCGSTGAGGSGGAGSSENNKPGATGGSGEDVGAGGGGHGGKGGGSDKKGIGTPSSGGPGQVILTWDCVAIDISKISFTATSPVCAGASTTVTATSSTLPTGTYSLYYYFDNNVSSLRSAILHFTAGSPGSGSFVIPNVSYGTTKITLATFGCTSAWINNTIPIVVQASPAASFISTLPSAICYNSTVTYTTQPGQSNYSWSVPGVANTDYKIMSGSLASNSNTVTLNWFTPGEKEVTVNYANSIGCASPSPAINKIMVSGGPVIVSEPADMNNCLKSTVHLEIEAQDPADVTQYKWYKDGVAISAAPSLPIYTINNLAVSDAGKYRLELTGFTGCTSFSREIIVTTFLNTTTTWMPPMESVSWNQPKNWSCGVPDLVTHAIIPTSLSYPKIEALETGMVNNFIIDPVALAQGVVVEGVLQIAGEIQNNDGILDVTNGTVEFKGLSPQLILKDAFANNTANNTVHNLIISNNVTLNGPLDITGTLSFGAVSNKTFTTNDHLTLKSSAAATARVADITNNGVNAGNVIAGNVSVERFIPAHSSRRWRLVTAPVQGVSINKAWQEGRTWNGSAASEVQGYGTLITGQTQGTPEKANAAGFDFWTAIAGGGASVRKYVGSSSAASNIDAAFFPVENTTTASFTSHEAYLLFVRGDRTISSGSVVGSALLRAKGPLKQETSYNIPVVPTQSHTLIGNPYASPISFRKLYADNSTKIQSHYWTWQAGLGTGVGGYVLMLPNGEGGWEPVPAKSGAGTTNPVIGSGEGFFVVPAATAATGNAIVLKEVHKDEENPSVAIFRQADVAPAKVRVNLFAQVNGEKILLDGVQARFNESEKTNMGKAVNSGENLSIYRNSKDLIVMGGALPQAGDSIQFRFWNLAARQYTLQISGRQFPKNLQAVLFDRYMATETVLSLSEEGTTYSFQVTAAAESKAALRFVIRFKAHQALPVKLTNFTAQEKAGSVQLAWQVEGAESVQFYTVERSSDASHFSTLLTEAARGAATEGFEKKDSDPLEKNYYRLKITERSGAILYSDIVKVELERKEGSFSFHPNPVTGTSVSVKFTAIPTGQYTLSFYALSGQRLATQVLQHGGGSAIHPVAVKPLSNGTYLLELSGPGVKERLQLVVTR
ncbi:MAG: hypothetical protein EOP49_00600 [Sphingobacteriales bacterium]|nr:MAG: hypothetical protein EOP49_00600 [Sphingobacteriales bacterium]